MSTRELFGDDSSDSDSDSDIVANKNKASSGTEKKPEETKKDDADDSSVEKGDKETKKKDGVETSPAKKKRPTGLSDSDSDDDDDKDDTQFDDKGAVVGFAAKEGTTIKKSNSDNKGAGSDLNDSDAENDENDEEKKKRKLEAEEKKKKDAEPVLESKKMILQEAVRPDPKFSKLFATKLPNLVGIQPAAFDPDHYSEALEEEEYGQSVYNLIRWRYVRDEKGRLKRDSFGNLLRESNARLVEWEDGSWSLHIGTEAFEIDRNDTTTANGFSGLNGYLYMSQKATLEDIAVDNKDSEENKDDNDDNNDNKKKNDKPKSQTAGTVLECMGAISARLTARPSSLQSESHQSLTVAVRQKTIKKARIAEYVTQEDPEKAKQARIKSKMDLDRATGGGTARRSTGGQRSGGGGGGGGRRRPRMSRDYMEEDDGDYDTININATKRRVYGGEDDDDDGAGGGGGIGRFADYEEEEDEDETFNAFKTRSSRREAVKAKASRAAAAKASDEDDDDDDDVIMNDADDDEEEVAPVVKTKKAASHRAVVDDDDDDDDDSD